jgi:hypothetical protein
MVVNSTALIALVTLIAATVPSSAEEDPKQTFTCTAKTLKGYQLNTKIIFRGNPVEGETISGGTMGEMACTRFY